MVQKDVKLTYDPATKELVQMVMPFMTASEVTTLKFDKGWVTEASVEDMKLLPGVSRTMYPSAGRRVGCPRGGEGCPDRAGQVRSQYRRPGVVGKAGRSNPPTARTGQLVNEDVLKQLPPPDREMQAAGLAGARLSRRRKPRTVGRHRR